MAKFIIGGKEHHVPEMNFLAVERAWPYVVEATTAYDPIKGSSAAISVIASAMFEDESFSREDWEIPAELPDNLAFDNLCLKIKRRMKSNEIGNAKDTMLEILKEGGLQVTEGELLQALKAMLDPEDPSLTETAESTLSSLLPQE